MQQFDLHKSLLLQRCSAIRNNLISNRVLRLVTSLLFLLKKKSLYLKITELVEKAIPVVATDPAKTVNKFICAVML